MILNTRVLTLKCFNDHTHSHGESVQFWRYLAKDKGVIETRFSLDTGMVSYLFFFRHDGTVEGRVFA